MRDSIFISYSHKDKGWAERFHEMLNTQRDEIKVFRDPDIAAGENWESRLEAELSRARIVLVLVSNHFLNSEFITNRELPWIMKARKEGLVVNWVEVEPTIPPDELMKLQAFKVQSSDRSMSQLYGPDQDPEIKYICERLISEMGKHARIPRGEFFNKVNEVVQRRFTHSVRREIAIGDHSVVYKADSPGKHLIVKAQVQGLFDEHHEDFDDITAELETAKSLKHPAFIRLVDWSLDTDPKIMVTELIRASRPLKRIIELKNTDGDADPIAVDDVRFVIQTIAEAFAEYHEAGLVYTNIQPSDVLITKPAGRWYPRISAYRAKQVSIKWEKRSHQIRMNQERLTYVTPEQYRSEPNNKKTDQYSLGLLAVEMLQGHPPVQVEHLADLQKKMVFCEDPEAFGGDWLQRSPGLTRVILRMLDPNPRKRWRNMNDIAEALGGQASASENNRWLAKQSFVRLMNNREDFLSAFYENLFSKRKSLRSMFPAEHDWKRQHAMLEDAIRSLLNFSAVHSAVEPTILTDTARRHQKLGLSASDYDDFKEAFIQTLQAFDEGSEEMQSAWRACFVAGIGYMKQHGTSP